jgi:hypothetical protein
MALAFGIMRAALQYPIVYGSHSFLYMTSSSQICFLNEIAKGLRIAIPAGLPTAALLFMATPYITRPDCVFSAYYLVLLCYLVGSTSGALLLQ